MRILALILVFGLFAGACISVPLAIGGRHGTEAPAEFAPKLVVGKVPPTELIAEDNSRCITSKDRFDRTRIGSEVWCLWTGGGSRHAARASHRH